MNNNDIAVSESSTAALTAPTGVGAMMMQSMVLAQRVSRDLKKIEAAVISEMNAAGAEAVKWKYSLPFTRWDKEKKEEITEYAEGVSIRAAEAIRRSWGFLFSETKIKEDRGDYVIVGAWVFDAVAGCGISVERRVSRLMYTKKGVVEMREDHFARKIDAEKAKCERDAIVKMAPQFLVQRIFGRATELASAALNVKDTLAAWSELGVTKGQLEAWLGKPLQDADKDDRVKLRGVYQAIKDDEAKVSDIFREASKPAEVRPPLDQRIDPVIAGKVYAEIGREKADALSDADLAPFLDKYKIATAATQPAEPTAATAATEEGKPY